MRTIFRFCALAWLCVLNSAIASFGGEVCFNPQNGHYYEFVKELRTANIEWHAAKAAAETRFLFDPCSGRCLQGYLATITSRSEQEFLLKNFRQHQNVWLGGSDGDSDKNGDSPNEWRWVTGPEKDRLFWRGRANGQAFGYERWTRSKEGQQIEPNDSIGGESYLSWNHSYSLGQPHMGFWNDLKKNGHETVVEGYLVEYGDCEFSSGCCCHRHKK